MGAFVCEVEVLRRLHPIREVSEQAEPDSNADSETSEDEASPSQQSLLSVPTALGSSIADACAAVGDGLQSSSLELLEQLHMMTDGPSSSVHALIDQLFDCYDVDENGLLEGREYDRAVSDLATHISRKAEIRVERYGQKSFVLPWTVIQDWV